VVGNCLPEEQKDLIISAYEDGALSDDPEKDAEAKGLLQKSDEGELKKIVEDIVKNNESVVADYKGGKESALMFLVGQGMKATKGSGNPQILKKLIIEVLG
jgi:aspartyl-tRNA(Asn)/glutamyl-tRNA(Gln) amidotransferase subunit B